jgi:hypothetical protein
VSKGKCARQQHIKITGIVGFDLLISVSEKPSLECGKLYLLQGNFSERIVCADYALLAVGAGCKAEEPVIVEINGLCYVGFPEMSLVGIDRHLSSSEFFSNPVSGADKKQTK